MNYMSTYCTSSSYYRYCFCFPKGHFFSVPFLSPLRRWLLYPNDTLKYSKMYFDNAWYLNDTTICLNAKFRFEEGPRCIILCSQMSCSSRATFETLLASFFGLQHQSKSVIILCCCVQCCSFLLQLFRPFW